MRKLFRTLGIVIGGAIGVAILAVPAAASFSVPGTNPFTVPNDGAGNPVSFNVTVSGFQANQLVYLEICDGVPSSSPGYDPADHCDNGSSTAGQTADGSGVAHFTAGDVNFGIIPFKGPSPFHLFNCLAPNDPNLGPSGTPDWGNTGVNAAHTSCQLRASSNNGGPTADQQFISLILPSGTGPVTPEVPYAVILPLGGLVAAGGFFIIRKRRANAHAA